MRKLLRELEKPRPIAPNRIKIELDAIMSLMESHTKLLSKHLDALIESREKRASTWSLGNFMSASFVRGICADPLREVLRLRSVLDAVGVVCVCSKK
jgi:hypothetical protein